MSTHIRKNGKNKGKNTHLRQLSENMTACAFTHIRIEVGEPFTVIGSFSAEF
jgi:hypothetical protein